MDDTQVPSKIPLVWASGSAPPFITVSIPTPSQQGVTPGAASFTDGFPPLCFVPVATGGAGPFGADFNGLLNQVTAGLQWVQLGGPLPYDATFSAGIGGYPRGALIASASTLGQWWQSTVDNNLSDPDTGGANWTSLTMISGGVQIIQVATTPGITCSAGYGQIPVTFPNAFPHACLQVVASDDGVFQGVVGGCVVYACSSITTTGFTLTAATPAEPTSTATVNARYVAVGY